MIDIINPMIKKFLPFAQERMGFKDPPKLFLRGSPQNAADPLGKTAFYDPQAKSVTIYITDRHPKDVMRSLSHELVHHTQNCQGHFDHVGEMGEGYAQNDEHLREMEREAYEKGNMCFRDWEDSIKSTIYFEHLQKGANKAMSIKEWKNGELTTILSEAFGFKFNPNAITEGADKNTDMSGVKGDDDDETYMGHVKKENEEPLKEDSGEQESEHDERNRDTDDAHISAIEHHLDALKHDRDYEEDHIEEGAASSGRQSPHKDRRGDDKRKRPMEESDDSDESVASNPRAKMGEEQIREVARRVIARLKESKKNG